MPFGSGRGDWIRTSDFHLPKMALYQAELRPDEPFGHTDR